MAMRRAMMRHDLANVSLCNSDLKRLEPGRVIFGNVLEYASVAFCFGVHLAANGSLSSAGSLPSWVLAAWLAAFS